MDFEKIKAAVEEIELSDSQKDDIINLCSGKKRKFNYKPLAAVAAVAAVIVVLVSPGFLFKASSPNESADMLMGNVAEDFDFYYNTADDAAGAEQQIVHSTSAAADIPLFDAERFSDIYAIIPYEFSSLVNIEEYEEWKLTVSAENGMAMLQFIEHFNISEEDFDTANTEYNARTPADQKTDNNYFNIEIIYSFDRELIDGFYAK